MSLERPDSDDDRIMLGVLQAVGDGQVRSQRHLASELGIAVGLANAYMKRCVRKGLMKVSEVPARRYAYYLTPQGFSEKARLTAEYLSVSFSFFRVARADCAEAIRHASERGWQRMALIECSEVAEIAALCALESGASIAGVADPRCPAPRFVGLPVVRRLEDLSDIDCALVCSLADSLAAHDGACALLGPERVLVPQFLRRAWGRPLHG
ncbi:MAG: winged helix-turn-helix transcriptional regulator [Alsobacter sp.]